MKKVLVSLCAVVMTALAANAQNDASKNAPMKSFLNCGITTNHCAIVVNPHGSPTAIVVEIGRDIAFMEEGLTGNEDIVISFVASGYDAGDYPILVWSINSGGITKWEPPIPQRRTITVNGKMKKFPRMQSIRNTVEKYNSLMAGIIFDPFNSYPAPGTNNIDFFAAYTGSTSALDQNLVQMGNVNSAQLDSIKAAYVTTPVNGQVNLPFVNLISGDYYKYRHSVFDALNGLITFTPSPSTCFQTNTIFVAQSWLSPTSYLSCNGSSKKIYLTGTQNNDPNATFIVTIDTGMVPTWASLYAGTYGQMPPISVGLVNNTSDSIDVTSYIVYVGPNIIYNSKVVMINTAGWQDSTKSTLPCQWTTDVNEWDSGESFVIYPNPVVDKATIEGTVKGNLKICDVTGREVWNKSVEPGQTVLFCKDILPGIYFYTLTIESGGMKAGKLIFAAQ